MENKNTYYKNYDTKGNIKPIDFTINQANIEISLIDIDYFRNELSKLVKGTLTLDDIISQEIEFHKRIKVDCTSLGFGNSVRVATHCIKVLESLHTPQQPTTETEQETPTFTNNFDNIKPTEIYKHFKAGLVEKGYLTEQELNEYLKAAFELKTKPETLFNLKHTPTKQKIYTVFYVYYKDISQKKHERQKEYAALLGDFFEGYKTETIQTNWARDYKTKR